MGLPRGSCKGRHLVVKRPSYGLGAGVAKTEKTKEVSKHRSHVAAISSRYYVMHVGYVSSNLQIWWAFLTSKVGIPGDKEPDLPAYPDGVLPFTCEWFMYAPSCKSRGPPPPRNGQHKSRRVSRPGKALRAWASRRNLPVDLPTLLLSAFPLSYTECKTVDGGRLTFGTPQFSVADPTA